MSRSDAIRKLLCVARILSGTSAHWPPRLWHGTSTAGLAKIRQSKTTKSLYLTSDENIAIDYAENSANADGSKPVLVEISVEVLSRASGSLEYDYDGDDDILEQFLYKGMLPKDFILKTEVL